MFDSNNFMGKMFGRLGDGMVRMSMNGEMAVKTSGGYKTYDVATGALVNCDNFVFDVTSEMFFLIPTNKVQKGDIILIGSKPALPHCVISVDNNRIEVLRYEDGSVINIVPERHVFMGKTYFYGKIVSMFGNLKGKNMNSMMKYMVMSQMMKSTSKNSGAEGFASMMPMMFLMGNGGAGMDNMFDGMFDLDLDEEETETEEKA